MRLSAELRDFCGFNRVPDASQFTRFRENYHSYLAQMFENLVDLTEPICREIDAKKADYFIYDTTGIELPVAENNPKFFNTKLREAKKLSKSNPNFDPYKAVYSFLPDVAKANPDARQQCMERILIVQRTHGKNIVPLHDQALQDQPLLGEDHIPSVLIEGRGGMKTHRGPAFRHFPAAAQQIFQTDRFHGSLQNRKFLILYGHSSQSLHHRIQNRRGVVIEQIQYPMTALIRSGKFQKLTDHSTFMEPFGRIFLQLFQQIRIQAVCRISIKRMARNLSQDDPVLRDHRINTSHTP